MTTINYPVIIVERPHQMRGSAWIANSDSDIITQLDECNYGDNYSYEVYKTYQDWIAGWGDDNSEWPTSVKPEDFPLTVLCEDKNERYYPLGKNAETELEFALGYIGHDLHSMNVLNTQEEAQALIDSRGHNIPYNEIKDCMHTLYGGS